MKALIFAANLVDRANNVFVGLGIGGLCEGKKKHEQEAVHRRSPVTGGCEVERHVRGQQEVGLVTANSWLNNPVLNSRNAASSIKCCTLADSFCACRKIGALGLAKIGTAIAK